MSPFRLIGFYVATFFVLLFLQAVSAHFLGRLSPDFLIVALVYVALYRGSLAGEVLGFGFGLIRDALSFGAFGARALAGVVIGYMVGRTSRRLDESHWLFQMGLVLLATFAERWIVSLMENVFSGIPLRWEGMLSPRLFVSALAAPLSFRALDGWMGIFLGKTHVRR